MVSIGNMIEKIFSLSDAVRYVAIYRDGQLESRSKSSTVGASSSESGQSDFAQTDFAARGY